MNKRLTIAIIFVMMLAPFVADSFEMQNIPAGTLMPFWVTPKSTAAKKKVIVSPYSVQPFKMMKYAVTKKQYIKFLKESPDWNKKNIANIFADSSYLRSFDNKPTDNPITEVSWFAARAFCEKHGMRLPLLKEWEYVAAASETKKDANQEEVFLRRILDWYGETKGKDMKTVGTVYKNLYGVWDMHGLVWEWVEDFNSSFITGESRENDSFNKDLFCGAGGMSGANKEDYAAFMRFAFRSSLKGNSSVWNLGFRCAR